MPKKRATFGGKAEGKIEKRRNLLLGKA